MDHCNLYTDIATRTGGDIYIGVVGPVRTGKSTLIKRFMELMILPEINDEAFGRRARDELPQSAAGRTIMTTEPKFVPEQAVRLELDGGIELRARMIDCVGYLVPGAMGHEVDDWLSLATDRSYIPLGSLVAYGVNAPDERRGSVPLRGIGFAQALGARFWRKDGTLLPAPAAGQDLAHIQRIDLSGLDPRLQQSEIQASCDVTNPLLGEHGATWVYGAQKGADEAALSELEAGMAHYSQLLTQTLGFDVSERPGAGAAGGMGAALIAYTGATLRPGIDLVLELLNADDHLRDAALTIVGEGWLDRQSAFGKAPVGVAGKAARHGVPVVALCGGRDESSRQLYQHHIDAMWSICQRPMALAESMNTCEPLLADAAENVLRTFLSGWRGEAHKRITV